MVLGRQGGLVEQTIIPFSLGLGGRMGSGNQVMPWIHVKDLASLVVYCVINKNCSGVYNAVSPHPTTNTDFVKAYARELNRPAIIPVPEFVFKAVFGSERANIITQSQVKNFPVQFLLKSSLFRRCYPGEPWSRVSVTHILQLLRLLRSLHTSCMKIRTSRSVVTDISISESKCRFKQVES